MKKFLLLLCLPFAAACAVETAASAGTPMAEPAKSQQELAYDAVWAIYREQHPDPELRKNNPREWFKFYDAQMQRFAQAARAYAASYPQDVRRYGALIQSSYTRPFFILGFKPEFDAAPRDTNLIVDQPATIAFWTAQLHYLAEVLAAPGLDARQKGGATVAYLVDSQALARTRGVPYDWTATTAFIETVVAKNPDLSSLPIVEVFRDALRRNQPDAVASWDAKVAAIPGIATAAAEAAVKREAAAAEKAKKLAALGSMKFTAADGREVELAKLRGKVVLIDFWATWCGPCIAEIPNVVANYNKYHDKGFEVIGITLENAGLTAKDTDAQRDAKLEKAKAKMMEFTERNGMPWPQFFDGKFWKGDYVQQFGIEGIPAMFLLDQEGNIVAQEARGPQLEAQIKRLLKI